MNTRKKLIEVSIPLDAINVACAREKSIRHGHPSTLHLWWARRPLAAARAVIFAQMVDDPGSWPELFPTEEAQEAERQRLFALIRQLVTWENTTNQKLLEEVREELRASWRRTCGERREGREARSEGREARRESLTVEEIARDEALFDPDRLPAFHDPFAGGGAIPLEAQRLGLESHASDLNPVAVLINKAMIEIPPRFAGRAPVNPDAQRSVGASLGSPLGPRASRPPSPDAGGTPAVPGIAPDPHVGWHSRGYLPHFDHPDQIQSVTFRLHDSVPQHVVDAWKVELGWQESVAADDPRAVELRKRLDRYEDAGYGNCWLGRPDVAELVQQALLHFDGERYRLLGWSIMPNHVHVLFECVAGYPLGGVVHSWKSFTAKRANLLLGQTGQFWMEDYYDRAIRDERHLELARNYIEQNPVKAGLVSTAAAWRWGSAWVSPDAGGTPAVPGGNSGAFPGATGLAEDVRYYGQWMRDEAEKRIGHLYPKIEITAEMVAERPDLKPYLGKQLTVIAWLWARTVKSPNPAFADVEVPLASTFMLSTKAGKEAYVEPEILRIQDPTLGPTLGPRASRPLSPDAGGTPAVPGGASYRFKVKVGKPRDVEAAKSGTKLARGANFRCVLSGIPISGDYIKAEGRAHRMGSRLMAIVAEGERGRVYLSPTTAQEAAALRANPTWKPVGEIATRMTGGNCTPYGLVSWGDLFTARQLVALTTFSDLVQEAREQVKRDYLAALARDPGPEDETPLHQDGRGATAYADAVAVYLSLGVDRLADRCSTICGWDKTRDNIRNTFGRQAIPMTWDFAEGNVFSDSTGNFSGMLEWVEKFLLQVGSNLRGIALQQDAQSQSISTDRIVSTDPPYYDNIGYADLSDYFYVWLRRSLRPIYPELFATLAVPKSEELVATPYRHGSKKEAEEFFLSGMTRAMQRLAEQSHPEFPVTIYYAFKQAETESATGTASTGWETFLDAVIRAGFALTGTWPIRTELGNRMISSGTNALASSIVLVCRKREAAAPTATRREFISALKEELPAAMELLQRSNIAPVDLAQAAIGPGMGVYTRYARVLDARGNPLSVRDALALINETLDEALAEQEGDFDADSRWALTWFEQHGFEEGDYGTAEQLSKSKNTSVDGMVDAGILESKRGKVRLLRPDELSGAPPGTTPGTTPGTAGVSPASGESGRDGRGPRGARGVREEWDPATDARLTAWEVVHQLIRALETGGESAAAELVSRLGAHAEVARELAYRLYTLCERKKRSADALAYNGLVQSWPEITRLAATEPKPPTAQIGMNL